MRETHKLELGYAGTIAMQEDSKWEDELIARPVYSMASRTLGLFYAGTAKPEALRKNGALPEAL